MSASNYAGLYSRPAPDPLGHCEYQVELTRNDHGWLCDSVNGQPWLYPPAAQPDLGWGHQFAKPSALDAVRSFLSQAPAWYGDAKARDTVQEVSLNEMVEA